MPTLGQRLREEREKRGLTIEDLAAQTRINAQYFQAIESEDIGSLPGGFFYRSFVRQYARLLELPESVYQTELALSLEAESTTASSQETALPARIYTVPPIPTGNASPAGETGRWLVGLGALVLVIVICSGVYTFWQHWQQQKEEQAKQAAAQASALAAAKPAPAPRVEPPPVTSHPLEPLLPPEQPETSNPAAQAPKTDVAKVPEKVAAAPVTAPSGAVQLMVKASELAWVGVWQRDRMLFGDMIQAGESRGFGAPDLLRVRLGNAGGVELFWNGKLIPPTGPRGQVRTVEFRPDGYSIILPASKPDAPATPPQP